MIRTQVNLEETQYGALAQIALEQGRSFSSLVREYLDEQLRLHEQRRLAQAAELLRHDYLTDSELTAFTVLDGEPFDEAG
jgi:predicted DNA-binding ribbon-helix-helix protein